MPNWRLFEFKDGERPEPKSGIWFWDRPGHPPADTINRRVLLDLPYLLVLEFLNNSSNHIQVFIDVDHPTVRSL